MFAHPVRLVLLCSAIPCDFCCCFQQFQVMFTAVFGHPVWFVTFVFAHPWWFWLLCSPTPCYLYCCVRPPRVICIVVFGHVMPRWGWWKAVGWDRHGMRYTAARGCQRPPEGTLFRVRFALIGYGFVWIALICMALHRIALTLFEFAQKCTDFNEFVLICFFVSNCIHFTWVWHGFASIACICIALTNVCIALLEL